MKVKCLVMCRNASGEPDCVPVIVECTTSQYENGDHYDIAEDHCRENDYEGNFLTFDEREFGNLARQFGLSSGESLEKMVDWKQAETTWNMSPGESV